MLSVFKGYDMEGNYTQNVFLDYIFYKQIIINLTQGQENISEWANILDKDYNGITPYHYFELWLPVLISKINDLPVLLNFLVYVPTIFISIILYGILSILENSKSIKISHVFIAVALLFVGQIYLPFYEYFFWSGYQHVFTSVGYIPISVKLFPFALFGLASFSSFKKKDYSLFIFYILFLSIVSFTATPAIFGALYFLLLFNLYFKFINNKFIYIVALFPLLYAIFLYIFKQPIDGYIENTSQIGTTQILQRFTLKNIIIYLILRPSYFLFPAFVLIFFLLIRKRIIMDKSTIFLIIFFAGIVVTSSFIAIFYSFDMNSIQLINLPVYGFSFAFLIWLISNLYRKMYIAIVFVISLIIINFYYNYKFFEQKLNLDKFYSAEYISFITDKIPSKKLTPVAAFYSLDIAFHFVSFNGLGQEVIYLDNVGLIRMSNAKLTENENEKNFSVNIFYKFVKENNYTFQDDMTEAQIAFFKKYNIKHLLIQKGQKISSKLESFVIESYTDSISGNRFCIIKL
ncbi:hypothetical protein V9L05_20845 [Bernardetia sp. Wsw4-3y2]|uniref:hypothetical protein n=1 Tax=Bernardetia sp. Wsw4-3y2 TaxID=3127471 RepID=UPI0030CC1538